MYMSAASYSTGDPVPIGPHEDYMFIAIIILDIIMEMPQ